MYNQFFIFFVFSFLLTLTIFPFTSVLSADDDGFFSVNPEDYYNLEDYGGKKNRKFLINYIKKIILLEQNALPAPPSPQTTTTVKKHPFNIAVTADWGCAADTKKTAENIQKEKS